MTLYHDCQSNKSGLREPMRPLGNGLFYCPLCMEVATGKEIISELEIEARWQTRNLKKATI